jgi:hypothetical protein
VNPGAAVGGGQQLPPAVPVHVGRRHRHRPTVPLIHEGAEGERPGDPVEHLHVPVQVGRDDDVADPVAGQVADRQADRPLIPLERVETLQLVRGGPVEHLHVPAEGGRGDHVVYLVAVDVAGRGDDPAEEPGVRAERPLGGAVDAEQVYHLEPGGASTTTGPAEAEVEHVGHVQPPARSNLP